MEALPPGQMAPDILQLNGLRRALLIGSHAWDRQLHSLQSILKKGSIAETVASYAETKELRSGLAEGRKVDQGNDENVLGSSESQGSLDGDLKEGLSSLTLEPIASQDSLPTSCHRGGEEDIHPGGEITANKALGNISPASSLSDRIDLAWTGTDQLEMKVHPPCESHSEGFPAGNRLGKCSVPVRVHSFDSALRFQERIQKGLPPSSLYLSTLRSFHASGNYRNMVRDPVSNVMRTYSQVLPLEAQKLNLILSSTPSFISSASHVAEGARLLLPHSGHNDMVIAVYDSDPTSIISYALSSKEYEDRVADKFNEHEGAWSADDRSKDSASAAFSAWQSFSSLDLEYMHYGSYGSEDASSSISSLFMDTKRSPHLTISFEDDSSTAGGKVKFSVTCYFAKQFDSLRKKCCPCEVDFIRSLSRCHKWSAQGGKSNVYFAKSLDERFIIKQVKKTELESFEEFAPEYFKYLTDSLTSGSPTCLAKVLGIYQVSHHNFVYTCELCTRHM